MSNVGNIISFSSDISVTGRIVVKGNNKYTNYKKEMTVNKVMKFLVERENILL